MRHDPTDDPLDYLDSLVLVEIDRPLGSTHPTHGFVYPVNYGYVPNTTSGDGEPLDVYVLGPDEPLARFEGRCVAVILREEEDDPKLVVVPDGTCPSDSEILGRVHFQERFYRSRIVRRRAP